MTPPISRRSALALASSVALAPLVGCSPKQEADAVPAKGAGPSQADSAFAQLSKDWMDATFKASPVYATTVGDHRFDGELDDISETGRAARAAIVKDTTAKLAAIDRNALSRDNQVDAAMLEDSLAQDAFTLDDLKDWSWDPLLYSETGSSAVYSLMAREFAPVDQRLLSAAARMEKMPDFLAAVRKALVVEAVPEVHAKTYAGQNGGATAIIDELILPAADKLGPDDRTRLMAAAEKAKAAVAEHQAWIEKTLIPGAKGDYQAGREVRQEAALFDQRDDTEGRPA